MFFSTLIFLILILIILFLWQSQMRSKELALKAALDLCEQEDVQLFDHTVSLKKVQVKRLEKLGHLAFLRTYEFDYGTDNKTRYRGRIVTHGKKVLEQSLKFQEGLSVLNRVNLDQNKNQDFTSGSAKILKFKNLKKPANQEQIPNPDLEN